MEAWSPNYQTAKEFSVLKQLKNSSHDKGLENYINITYLYIFVEQTEIENKRHNTHLSVWSLLTVVQKFPQVPTSVRKNHS